MTDEIRNAEKSGRPGIIKYLSDRFGKERVLKTMGDGVKRLAASEKDNYLTTKRSLIALRDIGKGEVIKKEDFAALRSEKNLKPGLSPDYADFISGKAVCKNIKNSEGILPEHFQ
jgi:sialic acid synthase SpsE